MKVIYIILGFLALGLGAVGVALPILPSTPFLLLAAFCFARSSEKLNTWFRGTRLYKNNLESFVRGRGMTWRTKGKIMAGVTVLMAIGFLCMKNVPVGRVCLAVVWAAHVIAFCFIIKTCPAGAEKEAVARDDQ